MNNTHKLRYCFSNTWKAPNVPLLSKDDPEFIKDRNTELSSCFCMLEAELASIDVSSNKGYSDLLAAVHVLGELRRYRFSISKVENKGEAFIPYTASNKGRID